MRYTKPQITGTFSALTIIKSAKIGDPVEQNTGFPTDGSAYKADE